MRSSRRIRQSGAQSESSVGLWLVAALLLVLIGAALWWLVGWPERNPPALNTLDRSGETPAGEELSIWFASRQEDALVSERRYMSLSNTPSDRAKASLQELISGPQGDALRTIPAEVKVRDLFIDDQGTAYVDFSEELRQTHPGGPWAEMLTLRSIMQTVIANVPEIKQVQILVEGREMETLAGHLDTRRPLDATWIMNQR